MSSGWLRSAEPSGGVYLPEPPAFALLMPGSRSRDSKACVASLEGNSPTP
jgi:hypothetical protein